MASLFSAKSNLISVVVAAAFVAALPCGVHAQDAGSSMAQSAGQAASNLTSDQQTAANSALCSVLGSQVPNSGAPSPSLLTDPKVISAAATIFASSTHLPIGSATGLLQGYVAQHATDILASCAVANATGGLTTKIPGASSMPSVPSMP